MKERSIRPARGAWSTEEDEALKAAVRAHGVKSWAVVSTVRASPCDSSCPLSCPACSAGLYFLLYLIAPFCPQHIKGRSGKQCRERWSATIDPDLRPFDWTTQEDAKLVEAHAKYVPAYARPAIMRDCVPYGSIVTCFTNGCCALA